MFLHQTLACFFELRKKKNEIFLPKKKYVRFITTNHPPMNNTPALVPASASTSVKYLAEELERTTEGEWRFMSLEDLEVRFVMPLLDMSERRLARLLQKISESSFDFLTKKLWDAQDIPPNMGGYERSMNVMLLLRRVLVVKMATCGDELSQAQRIHLTKQLGLISVILDPQGLAQRTGLPLEASR
jgi:hypothetical protein